jgi:hypothetical protein
MERFVRKENVKHYRDLLRSARSETERQRIQVLLDEELKKQTEAGDQAEAEDANPSGKTDRPVDL